jgi:hypothetical protein
MGIRHVLAAATAATALLSARGALAWQEAHQTGDDVRVHIDAGGNAQVEHRLVWHVVRGPLKSIDLLSVDPAAELDPEVTIAGEDGKTWTGHTSRRDERTVRISVDDPRALMRGTFAFRIRWRQDLVASHALARDAASFRLSWSAPVATDGFDAAKTVFELPAAPDAPVPVVADTGAVDDAVVSSLRRDPGTDAIELVRPHVARGEAPVWTLRIDPRALPLVVDPVLRPPSEARAVEEPDRVHEALLVATLLALALAFGGLVHRKTGAFAVACEARGLKVRALLPLGDVTRAIVAGLALAGAVGLELRGDATQAAVLVALSTLAAALRAPASKPDARGPGRWLVLQPQDAFEAMPGVSVTELLLGAAVVGGVLLAGVAASLFASPLGAEGPWLVAIDSVALLPLVLTGRASQLPPDGARSAAPWLRTLHARLCRVASLRSSPWARMPIDASRPDELRLLVLPRAAMPGLVGVEVGLAWSQTPVGWAGTPEILVRFLEGSAAAVRLARELSALPASRAVPGRRPEERVVRLVPRRPSQRHAAALIGALNDAFTDRRVADVTWTRSERRSPAVRVSPSRVQPLVATTNPG